MPHLRLALAAGALLAVPAFSSCGFDYPTNEVNNIGAGVTDRDGAVDVVGTLVVAGQSDAGTLAGGLSNNDDEAATLTGISGGENGAIEADEFEPVEIPGNGHVNLAALAEEGDGITVTGDFDAGQVVTVTFEFDTDQTTTLEVPVVKACYQYEDLDVSTAGPSGSESSEALYSCEESVPSEEPADH